MVCIYCGGNTRVVNSRSSKRNSDIWRRRQCDSCKAIFTTNELPDLSRSVSIINIQGSLETFSTDKLYMSIFKALSHREDALNDARHITNTITTKLLKECSDGAIEINDLKIICLNTLEKFDKVAGTYYSAYYPISSN
jgi:transcriptional repressor NrdR